MLREEMPKIVSGKVPGPKSQELLERRNEAVPKALSGNTYPICIERGEGAMIEDLDGKIKIKNQPNGVEYLFNLPK